MGIKTKPRRFAVSLLDAFDNLKVQRVKNGMDTRTMSDARISDGLAHDIRFKGILDDFATKPRKKK